MDVVIPRAKEIWTSNDGTGIEVTILDVIPPAAARAYGHVYYVDNKLGTTHDKDVWNFNVRYSKKTGENMYEKLTALSEIVAAARNQVEREGKACLNEAFAELFAKYPRLLSVRWTQYTPYFNDGEPCTFDVNGWEAKVVDPNKSTEEQEDEDDEDLTDKWDLRDTAVGQDIRDIFRLVTADMLEEIFGEGRVVVTRDGIDMQDYDHD